MTDNALIALCFTFGVLKAAGQAEWVKPWFCHDLDCPKYTNLKNITIAGKSIEIRRYEPALWISTVIQNTKYVHDMNHYLA